MRVAQLFKVAVVLTALACEGGPTAPAVPVHVETQQGSVPWVTGDLIELDVHLKGCFHDQHLIASLRIDGDSAIVETFRGTGNFAPGYGFQPVRSVSAVQLAGLFQLLEDYQRPAAGWCSSSDRGRVTITRSGESARVEEFDGNSCGRFDDGEPTFNWFMLAEIVALTDKAG